MTHNLTHDERSIPFRLRASASPCHDAAMRKYLAAFALVPLLVACGGDTEPDQAAPTTTAASSTPSPTPTVAKVGDAAICTLLIDRDPAPFSQAINLMKKDYAEGDEILAADVTEALDDIAARAESETLAVHVGALADEMRDIFLGSKTDTADFVASATEVNNLCGNTARF